MIQGTETVAASTSAEDQACQCRSTPQETIICPACAGRQLLALLDTLPNLPISPAEREALSVAINGWFSCLEEQVGVKEVAS